MIRLYKAAYANIPQSVWILSLALFINRFGMMVLPFFTLYATTELGYSESKAGYLLSFYGVGSLLGVYLAGRLIPKVGAIRLQIVALLITVPIFFVLPILTHFWSLALGLFFLAFFSDAIRPANSTAITHFSSKDEHLRSFGLQRMAVNLGNSFGPAIGGFLATLNFVWLFIIDGTTTLLGAITLFWFFGWSKDGEKLSQTKTIALNKSNSSPLNDKIFVFFLVLVFATAMIFCQFFSIYPLYLHQAYKLSEFQIGMVFVSNTILIVLVEMLLLNYLKKYNLLACIALGGFLSCLGFGILPFGSGMLYALFAMLFVTVGEMLWMPLCSVWIARRSDGHNTAMYMSWYAIIYSIIHIITPSISGYYYEIYQYKIWYVSLLVAVLIPFGYAMLHKAVQNELPHSV